MGRRVGQHTIHKVPVQAAYIRAAESKLLQECKGASCVLQTKNSNAHCQVQHSLLWDEPRSVAEHLTGLQQELTE